MPRPLLWMLLSDLSRPDLHLAAPTLAWMAGEAGALFEGYFESPRDGRLFARTGSTVLGGFHHQQFNYLLAAFDVRFILLGRTSVFDSTIDTLGCEVLARGDDLAEVYAAVLRVDGVSPPESVLLAPGATVRCGEGEAELGPYLFPDIYYARALALPHESAGAASRFGSEAGVTGVYLSADQRKNAEHQAGEVRWIDEVRDGDDMGSLTLRIARRWKGHARAVVFGDPPAVLSQIASHCLHRRVAVYAPKRPLPPGEVVYSAYTEQQSAIADETARLALEVGNRVLVGRQTGDGDLFAWSKSGVCMQIIDPNRPAFPVVDALPHRWADHAAIFDDEPSDAQLGLWADEGKVLATLLWHSGEVAHNEAMLNLVELAGRTGVKMGIGVHAQRYATCPQLWELIAVARDRGGARGLIEPVLHSGGLGVLAEYDCPPDALADHCNEAMQRIRAIAGESGTPRGYYAFMDADLPTLSKWKPKIYHAIASAGLEYVVSSVTPGRNRIVHDTNGCVVINQSCRVIHGASPFVRITTPEDLATSGHTRPGWMIGTLDAPVISFLPYIWREGSGLMRIVDRLTDRAPAHLVNVTPRTVARYARLLKARGLVPPTLTQETHALCP